MKIKFNWGHGILIAIILIFSSIISFFIYISHLNNNLVEDDYYEKELVYENRINKIRNMEALGEKISILDEGDFLKITFPSSVKGSKPKGSILFYRPSDKRLDYQIPVELDDSAQQFVDKKKLAQGRYVIKIDWALDGKAYYQESNLLRSE